MNFHAWFSQVTHRKPVDPGAGCHGIQPLLSLYSDKMTASAESVRVEAHLAACEDCRRALSWMQATNAVLAHREPVLPPPDMALRIRSAIAQLEAGQAARPARVPLVYRPAFAAAFTILIGAVVVAQITLRPNSVDPAPASHGAQVAVKPSAPQPSPAPPLFTKPAAPVVAPIHRHSDVKVAKRLPIETAPEVIVGDNFVAPATDKVKRTHAVKIPTAKPLEGLHEIHVVSDTHAKPPQLSAVKANAAPHARRKTSPLPSVLPARRSNDALIASRNTAPHDTPNEAPVVAPSPPLDTVRVATAQTHSADLLSAVRSKVDDMHTVNYELPPSARSASLIRHANETGPMDLSRGTNSGLLPAVYDPGPPPPAKARPLRNRTL